MNKNINFEIKKGEDGYYTASCFDFDIHTQGKTLDELFSNIKESLGATFVSPKKTYPQVMASLDFSKIIHA